MVRGPSLTVRGLRETQASKHARLGPHVTGRATKLALTVSDPGLSPRGRTWGDPPRVLNSKTTSPCILQEGGTLYS